MGRPPRYPRPAARWHRTPAQSPIILSTSALQGLEFRFLGAMRTLGCWSNDSFLRWAWACEPLLFLPLKSGTKLYQESSYIVSGR